MAAIQGAAPEVIQAAQAAIAEARARAQLRGCPARPVASAIHRVPIHAYPRAQAAMIIAQTVPERASRLDATATVLPRQDLERSRQ